MGMAIPPSSGIACNGHINAINIGGMTIIFLLDK
jgi:hypothetical protein